MNYFTHNERRKGSQATGTFELLQPEHFPAPRCVEHIVLHGEHFSNERRYLLAKPNFVFLRRND